MKLFLLVIAVTLCIANAGGKRNKFRDGSSGAITTDWYGHAIDATTQQPLLEDENTGTVVECPQLFNIKIGGKCFHIGPPGVRLNWMNAKEKCFKLGGHLAILDTAEKNNGMYDYINNNKEYVTERPSTTEGPSTTEYINYWIGAYDLGHEGVWYWDTASKPLRCGYTNWRPNEPNNADSKEHCASLELDGWNDLPCFESYINYICEHSGNVPQ